MRHVLLTDVAATKCGFLRRHRKLDGASFVQTRLRLVGQPQRLWRGASASSRLARCADKRLRAGQTMQRAGGRVPEAGAPGRGRAGLAATDPAAVPILRRFLRVHAYDGSVVSLPEALRDRWPGLGGNGPDVGAALKKIGVRLDWACITSVDR